MAYQSFDDGKPGASRSADKLHALRLDKIPSLEGKSVLDIGCNEGFFCGAALSQGATRVVGVDRSAPAIEAARARFPDAEFHRASWWDIPNEKFDLILFLSAVHYEPNPKALFAKLHDHLTPDGVLILECGLAELQHGMESWLQIYRNDNLPKRYATPSYLTNHVLRDFAVVSRGRSVDQKGDPISRWVLHCRKRQPAVMIVKGKSGDGKSIFSASFAKHGVPVYRTDALFQRLVFDQRYGKTPLALALRETEHAGSASGLSKEVVTMGMQDHFAEIVCDEAPLESDVSIIEGEAFVNPELLEATRALLKERGVRVWIADTN